jgi:hypothetical protein
VKLSGNVSKKERKPRLCHWIELQSSAGAEWEWEKEDNIKKHSKKLISFVENVFDGVREKTSHSWNKVKEIFSFFLFYAVFLYEAGFCLLHAHSNSTAFWLDVFSAFSVFLGLRCFLFSLLFHSTRCFRFTIYLLAVTLLLLLAFLLLGISFDWTWSRVMGGREEQIIYSYDCFLRLIGLRVFLSGALERNVSAFVWGRLSTLV